MRVKKEKFLKMICVLLTFILIGSLLIIFLIPNFQFKTYAMNRVYGIALGVLSSVLFFLLFWVVNEIKSKKTRHYLFFMNAIAFVFAVGNLAVYHTKIDPNVQFRDYETLFVNEQNPEEQIISQYDVNWKTNKKEFQNNHVENIGIFRIYKKYNIDTLNLEKKWSKKILPNAIYN